MNIFEKVAKEFSNWQKSTGYSDVEHDEPNRHQRRFTNSYRRRLLRKLDHNIFILGQMQSRPTAHIMLKPRPGCKGKTLQSAQVAT